MRVPISSRHQAGTGSRGENRPSAWGGCPKIGADLHDRGRVYHSTEDWRAKFANARVHIQWDPERTLLGQPLDRRSIQVALSRHVIDHYIDDWIMNIQDLTPLVRKIHRLINDGNAAKANGLLPPERVYPIGPELATRIGVDT